MSPLEIGLKGAGALISAALLAMPAGAQNARPAKLIIIHSGSVAVTDYPSMARCEAAQAYIAAMVERANANRQTQQLPGGGVIVEMPLSFRTYCISG
jgi:hypothetical protein